MSSAKNKYFVEIKILLVAFIFACGLWYIVVGNEQIESDIIVPLEYRSLPTSLVMLEETIDTVNLRVRASSKLLQSLESRDLSYPIDLSNVESGANIVHIEIAKMPNFKGLDVISIDPAYVVVEVDSITTKNVPIQIDFIAMKGDGLQISKVNVSPSIVEVEGPATILRDLEYLTVPFDLNKVAEEGAYSRPLQLVAPAHLTVKAPLATLSFNVAKKNQAKKPRPANSKTPPTKYSIQPKKTDLPAKSSTKTPVGSVQENILDSTSSSQVGAIVNNYSKITMGETISAQTIFS